MNGIRSLCFLALLFIAAVAAGPFAANNLLVEYRQSPVLGVDVAAPRFSWLISHTQRAQNQSAYQIIVSVRLGGIVWNSGVVKTGAHFNIPYDGTALTDDTSYMWTVIWWDLNGVQAPLSQPAFFDTGFIGNGTNALQDAEGAQWIGGYNQLRTTFTLPAGLVRANAFVVGLGYHELWVNGAKVDDTVLQPAWTAYAFRSLYVTYNVTGLLIPGAANAIGVTLGRGWWGQGWNQSSTLMFQLRAHLSTGFVYTVVSNTSNWRGAQGPIIYDSVYNGETYDARLEQDGWTEPNFDDSDWSTPVNTGAPTAIVAGHRPTLTLSSQMTPPTRPQRTVNAVAITTPQPGVYVVDFGQNMAGFVQMTVWGPAGTNVSIRHAEILYQNGSLNVANLRSAAATDHYVLRGSTAANPEVYRPRFTYHGFRFAELRNFPGVPSLTTLVAFELSSDVEQTGQFAVLPQNSILNQIHSNILWGQRSNLMGGVATDCDQRDERLGWMADAQLSAVEAVWNFEMGAFYTRFLQSMNDDQQMSGKGYMVCDTSPQHLLWNYGACPADPAWGAAYPEILTLMLINYNDLTLVAHHYTGVKAWINFLLAQGCK